jgi:hypothetical protein
MKLAAEYLEQALQFERMAADSDGGVFKDSLLKQAAAYRKLAGRRAEQLGLTAPSDPPGGVAMLGDPQECRNRAQECQELAARARTPQQRELLESLGQQWRLLATDLEQLQGMLDAYQAPDAIDGADTAPTRVPPERQ